MLRGDRVAGRFEILGEAGRGGMGTVFRVHDRRARQDVALKVLTAGAVGNLARFEREATLLAAVRHPNIVEYVAHGATPDGLHYLVMEWVEGESLAQRLARAGLELREVVAMAIQVARALGGLHAAGVVHRDVKPSNLMLVGGAVEHIKLVDLGVARRTHEPIALTRTGATVGTLGYMAPEQVRGDRDAIDGRTDLFALGCILHECLAGAPLFRADSALAVRAKVLLHDPPQLRQLAPWVPAPLEALVTHLLERRADDRPADAATVERALGALGELPSRAATSVRPASPSATRTAAGGADLGAALVALPAATPDELATIAGLAAAAAATVEPLEDGVVVTLASLTAIAALATEVAAHVPRAVIAVASGESITDVVDRCAQLLDAVELAAAAGGPAPTGAWVDAIHLQAVRAPAITTEIVGPRVRLQRATT